MTTKTAQLDQLERILTFNRVGLKIQEELNIDNIYRIIGEGLKEIGLYCVIMLLDEEQKYLYAGYISILPSIVTKGEKLLGIKNGGLKVPVESAAPVARAMRDRRAVFTSRPVDMIYELNPSLRHAPMIHRVAKMMHVGHAICAPLIARGKVFGSLAVWSEDIPEEEIPIVVAFTNQAAIAIDNAVRLPLEFEARAIELEKSEKKYRQLLENMKDGYAVVQNGKVVFTNGRLDKIFGYEPGEMMGLSVAEFIAPEDLQDIMEIYRKVVRGEEEEPDRVEVIAIKRSGITFPVQCGVNTIEHEGKPAFSIIIRDVTERKKLEDQLKKYSENLEQIVEDRTLQLEDVAKALIRTEKLAAIGELAGSIAHELRNPLGAVKASAHFLKIKMRGTSDEKLIKHLDILEKQTDICNSIIMDLLYFSRPAKSEIVAVDIDQLVREILLNTKIPWNVEISTSLAGDLAPVMADRGHLERVFSNAVSNSIEAMPNGGNLFLSTNQNGSFIEVRIVDTGIGITEEDLGKIFEPLFTTKAKGVGLGLSLAKALVDEQKGTIDVQSQFGKGTAFTVKFPIT